MCLLKSGKECFGGNWLSIHAVRKRESMNGLMVSNCKSYFMRKCEGENTLDVKIKRPF